MAAPGWTNHQEPRHRARGEFDLHGSSSPAPSADQRRRESDSAARPATARPTPTAVTPTVMRAAPAVSGSTPSVAPAAVRDSTTAVARAISAHAGNATLLRQARPGRARSVHAIATFATSQLATAAAIAMSVPQRAWTRRNVGRTAAVSGAAGG